MDKNDIYYKAYSAFRKLIADENETVRFQKISSGEKGLTHEVLKSYRANVTIDEEWIKNIELGLPFIEKAIKEERQFIKNDGEVLPIEKIRKTSTASIQDLARHSNYITHGASNDGPSSIIPDKLLMIQRENDFAVYENRVIYACLVYLRDFVSSRLTAIKEAISKYEVSAMYDKDIDMGSRVISMKYQFHEKRVYDPLVIQASNLASTVERIENIMALVLAFLKTPLMIEVGKVDMVSRPITKTNVLRMNRNFRESLNLFDYVATYEGLGYEIKNEERVFNPFKTDMVKDYSNDVLLLSFITYMHANNLEPIFMKNLHEEEERAKREEQQKLLDRLKAIHVKAGLDSQTIDDYLIAFEDGYRVLEKKKDELEIALSDLKVAFAKQKEELENKYKEELAKQKDFYEEELDKIEEEHKAELDKIEEEHQQEIDDINNKKEEEIADAKEEDQKNYDEMKEHYETQLSDLYVENKDNLDKQKEEFEKQIADLKTENENQINQIKTDYDNQMTDLNNQRATENKAQNDKYTALQEDYSNLEGAKKKTDDLNLQMKSYMLALKIKNGELKPNDFASKEKFLELDSEKEAFLLFYSKAWAEAKKEIRKRILGKEGAND